MFDNILANFPKHDVVKDSDRLWRFFKEKFRQESHMFLLRKNDFFVRLFAHRVTETEVRVTLGIFFNIYVPTLW